MAGCDKQSGSDQCVFPLTGFWFYSRNCIIFDFPKPRFQYSNFLLLYIFHPTSQQIFVVPPLQKTGFGCFLKVLLSRNVSAVFVLVGLVVAVVYETNIKDKSAIQKVHIFKTTYIAYISRFLYPMLEKCSLNTVL